jgi:hemolysin activation/secretion protein
LLAESLNAIISNYKTNYVTLSYQFLKPNYNNFLFPLNSKLFFEYGFGNRKSSNNNENQTQITLDAFKIFNLNSKNSIYIKTNVSKISSGTYLENELLRFGGINSLRGFEENSLFANIYGLINTEYRFQLSNSIYAHTIIDAAYFENKIINIKEKLFGYGLGLGIYTKAGLFRFNYANGKIENTKFKLANSKIHVSLTSNF